MKDDSDELCTKCSKLGIYSLFTGPRYFPGNEYRESFPVATLAEVNANIHCPFCRLLHHELYTDCYTNGSISIWGWGKEGEYVDPSKVQVTIRPFRADYFEEMKYVDEGTREKVATILRVTLVPLEGLSEKEENLVRHHHSGNGIQLLSPESINPDRPLKNGYQYTSTSKSLEMLRGWLEACSMEHTSDPGTCRRPKIPRSHSEFGIRVIDVLQRTIIAKKPDEIEYAALSYVWSQAHGEIANLDDRDIPLGSSNILPLKIPKVVEDAIFVCKELSIPYLWVDRHCIDQSDALGKVREIETMAFRYLHAKITLISGRVAMPTLDNPISHTEVGLLPEEKDTEGMQRIEKVQGRKYITALPSISGQIISSQWNQRAWTMQEGQLANRCAFFGDFDVSFLCGSGHWRETLHSGPHGHDAKIQNIDLACEGHNILSWPKWTRDTRWRFEDYQSLLMTYTPRQSTFESDRLNAVTGCLNFIGETKGVQFFQGMPTTDFHYALIWIGEYGRPRCGFPSWSWAGWHCLQTYHLIYPKEDRTSNLSPSSQEGNLQTTSPMTSDAELQGTIVSLTERSHLKNKCRQSFASISVIDYKTSSILEITSEVAHFSVDILSCVPTSDDAYFFPRPHLNVPDTFDSTHETTSIKETTWNLSKEYYTPYARFRLRDSSGNTCQYHYPRWYDHWPPTIFKFPSTLNGNSIKWLLEGGIDLVKILEVEVLEGDVKPFHLVFCLGIDNRGEVHKRFGMFCLLKEVWERAERRSEIVRMG